MGVPVFPIVGGLTGGAAGAVGSLGLSRPVAALAHGISGGVASVLQGGKFGSGFLSSAFTKTVSGRIREFTGNNVIAGTVGTALVGGTASVLGGGKFANGAQTAAIQYLFNEVATTEKADESLKTKPRIRYEVTKLEGSLSEDRISGSRGDSIDLAVDATVVKESFYYESLPTCCRLSNVTTDSIIVNFRGEITATPSILNFFKPEVKAVKDTHHSKPTNQPRIRSKKHEFGVFHNSVVNAGQKSAVLLEIYVLSRHS